MPGMREFQEMCWEVFTVLCYQSSSNLYSSNRVLTTLKGYILAMNMSRRTEDQPMITALMAMLSVSTGLAHCTK